MTFCLVLFVLRFLKFIITIQHAPRRGNHDAKHEVRDSQHRTNPSLEPGVSPETHWRKRRVFERLEKRGQ